MKNGARGELTRAVLSKLLFVAVPTAAFEISPSVLIVPEASSAYVFSYAPEHVAENTTDKSSSSPATDHGSMKDMDHGDMGGMKHGGMSDMPTEGMQDMKMGPMQGGKPAPDARDPDAYAEGLRYGAMRGMDMPDNELYGRALIDQLEYLDTHSGAALRFDGQAWYGGDRNKIWLKAEGEYKDDRLGATRTEGL